MLKGTSIKKKKKKKNNEQKRLVEFLNNKCKGFVSLKQTVYRSEDNTE